MHKRVIIILVSAIFVKIAFSQGIAVNNTGFQADTSAMLDVFSADKGILIPRIALTDTADGITILSPAHSLMVFNTGTGGGLTEGFYYNEGTSVSPHWVELVTNPVNQSLNLAGNKIINLATCTDDNDAANKAYVDAAVAGGGGGGNNVGANISEFTVTKSSSITFVNCITTCRNATDNGHNDWRVPSMDEHWWATHSGLITPPDGWIDASYWTTEMGHSTGSVLTVKEVTPFQQIDLNATVGTGSCRCVR